MDQSTKTHPPPRGLGRRVAWWARRTVNQVLDSPSEPQPLARPLHQNGDPPSLPARDRLYDIQRNGLRNPPTSPDHFHLRFKVRGLLVNISLRFPSTHTPLLFLSPRETGRALVLTHGPEELRYCVT